MTVNLVYTDLQHGRIREVLLDLVAQDRLIKQGCCDGVEVASGLAVAVYTQQEVAARRLGLQTSHVLGELDRPLRRGKIEFPLVVQSWAFGGLG